MHKLEAQTSKKCDYLIKLLSLNIISDNLNLSDKNLKTIRIIDISNKFKKCRCYHGLWSIGAINYVPLDLNTGRSIDIGIQRVKKKKGKITIFFCYAIPSRDGISAIWSGEITFERKRGELIVKEFRHGID